MHKSAPTGPIPLSNFFIQFGVAEGVPGPNPITPKFTVVALKMRAYSPQNRQTCNFWNKFAPKWVYPLKRFLHNLA